jgi:hypothetical protein
MKRLTFVQRLLLVEIWDKELQYNVTWLVHLELKEIWCPMIGEQCDVIWLVKDLSIMSSDWWIYNVKSYSVMQPDLSNEEL